MTNEEIVTKVSIDEVEVSKPIVETINVEEVATQIAELKRKRDTDVAQYDNWITEYTTNRQKIIDESNTEIDKLQAKLDKASEVGVTPDGVAGEHVEPVVEETPVIE